MKMETEVMPTHESGVNLSRAAESVRRDVPNITPLRTAAVREVQSKMCRCILKESSCAKDDGVRFSFLLV